MPSIGLNLRVLALLFVSYTCHIIVILSDYEIKKPFKRMV